MADARIADGLREAEHYRRSRAPQNETARANAKPTREKRHR
jgi:hypothetical protein